MELNARWLIKSGGRILGPMTTDDVGRALLSKEIVPLDEVAAPFGRWHYVRDEKEFERALVELRKPQSIHEQTLTDTANSTATDITERISTFGSEQKLTAGLEQQIRGRSPANQNSDRELPVYGAPADENFQKMAQPRVNLFIWLALVLLAGGLSIKVMISKAPTEPPVPIENYFKMAKDNYALGEYSQAVQFYQKVPLENLNADDMLETAGARLALKQSLETRQSLERLLFLPSITSAQKMKAQVGLAVATLQDFNYASAKKYLDEAEKIQKDSPYVILNRAVVDLYEQHAADAEKILVEFLKNHEAHPIASFLLSEAYLAQAKEAGDKLVFAKVKPLLEAAIRTNSLFAQENLALLTYTLLDGQDPSLDGAVARMLDADPQLTEDHIMDPYISRERLSWDLLAKYLRSAFSENTSPRVQAALGYALFRGQDKLEGKRLIEEACVKAPEDQLLRSVLSFVQIQLGHEDEGLAGLNAVLEPNQTLKLPLLLKARWCLAKKDYACSEAIWKQMLEREDGYVPALAGLSQVLLETNKLDLAMQTVRKGLAQDSQYRPFLKLNAALKARGQN